MARVHAKGVRAVTHHFATLCGKMQCDYQPEDRSEHRNTSGLPVAIYVTSFDARWQANSKMNQPAQRTEESECTASSFTPASPLHYAVTLRQNAKSGRALEVSHKEHTKVN